jgi:hypothetical protein
LFDGLIAFFESPWTSLFLGFFIIYVGWIRGRRQPPTSLTAGGGRIVFAIAGLLLLLHAFYQMTQQP